MSDELLAGEVRFEDKIFWRGSVAHVNALEDTVAKLKPIVRNQADEIVRLKACIVELLPLADQARQMNEDLERFGVLPPDQQIELSCFCDKQHDTIEQAKAATGYSSQFGE